MTTNYNELVDFQVQSMNKSDNNSSTFYSKDEPPFDAQAYNNYAYSLAERNQNVQFALELAQNAIRLEPKSAPYLDTVGWIYFKLENYDEALKYIKESLSIDTENSTIQDHLNQVIKKKAQTNKPNIQQVKNRD